MALLRSHAEAARKRGSSSVGRRPSVPATTWISQPSPAESTQLLPSVPVARIVQVPFSETKTSMTACR